MIHKSELFSIGIVLNVFKKFQPISSMSDSEDEVQSRTVKITLVGEPSTGKVSISVYLYLSNISNSKMSWPNIQYLISVVHASLWT